MSQPTVYSFGPFVLDRPKRTLLRDGAPVALTPKALDLLFLLVEYQGRVVSKETLMLSLWPDTAVEESNLTFQISALRKALGEGRYIVTVPGRGYQFAEPVQRQMQEKAAEKSMLFPWIAAGALVIVVTTTFLALRPAPPPPAQLATGIRSIAVLPFRPIDAAQRNEALELGMADTLITRLSHVPGVVVSPTSAIRRYDAIDQNPLDAARELRVDAVLDGSLQRSGERMRVTVRLLRTSNSEPLWSAQFDENASDLFAVQDRVADGVARSVVPTLSLPQERQLVKKPTANLEAYDLYVKGIFLREQDDERALDYFERALEEDPQFASAWAAIAQIWLMRGRFMNRDPREPFRKARDAAEKAIALDPDLGDGHAALAAVYGDYEWRWADAEREFERALAANPNDALAHNWYASLSVFRRRFERALAHSARSLQLDPLSAVAGTNRGMVLRFSGHNDEAIRHLQETLRLRDFSPAYLHLGMAYVNAGHADEGMQVLRLREHVHYPELYAYAAAKAGKRDEALRVLREHERATPPDAINAMNMAVAWTALGEHDRAFAWLERAYAKRSYLLRVITVEQGFDPLRSDPRFVDLIRRMGI